MTALQADELSGVDCSGLYHDVNRILNTYINKPIHTNITKAEHLELENLRKDMDCIIVTDVKGVAVVLVDKIEYITKCDALLQDNSVHQHLSKDTSPTIKKNSLKFGKATRITISSLKQGTPYQDLMAPTTQQQDFMVFLKSKKQHVYTPHHFSLLHKNIHHCQIHQ